MTSCHYAGEHDVGEPEVSGKLQPGASIRWSNASRDMSIMGKLGMIYNGSHEAYNAEMSLCT